jgi:hypothetical protein
MRRWHSAPAEDRSPRPTARCMAHAAARSRPDQPRSASSRAPWARFPRRRGTLDKTLSRCAELPCTLAPSAGACSESPRPSGLERSQLEGMAEERRDDLQRCRHRTSRISTAPTRLHESVGRRWERGVLGRTGCDAASCPLAPGPFAAGRPRDTVCGCPSTEAGSSSASFPRSPVAQEEPDPRAPGTVVGATVSGMPSGGSGTG